MKTKWGWCDQMHAPGGLGNGNWLQQLDYQLFIGRGETGVVLNPEKMEVETVA